MSKFLIAALLAALLAVPGSVSADVVTFESFAEGNVVPDNYTDSGTGFRFSQGPFTIEYANRPEYGFFFVDNKFLSKGGYSAGPGFGLLVGNDMSVRFPAPVERAGADIGWSYLNPGAGQIELRGYDVANNLVASAEFLAPSSGAFGSAHLEVSGPATNPSIIRLEFDATSMGAGYDNVFAVPEPTAALLCGSCCVVIARLRRRRTLRRDLRPRYA